MVEDVSVRVGPSRWRRRQRRFAAVQWERPFDLSVPGLVRFAVVRTGGGGHRLIVTSHPTSFPMGGLRRL